MFIWAGDVYDQEKGNDEEQTFVFWLSLALLAPWRFNLCFLDFLRALRVSVVKCLAKKNAARRRRSRLRLSGSYAGDWIEARIFFIA